MIGSLLHPVAHNLTNLPGQPPHTPTVIAYVLLDVFLIVALARILGNLMTKIGQPRVVGEILAGVLLGPTLLGADLSFFIAPAEARPVLSAIATIALILFMFLAGVEYDTEVIRGRAAQAGTLAVLAVAIPALLGFPVAAIMHNSTYAGPKGADFLPFALFIGAALAVTAFPVMAHILMERGQLNSKMGGLGVASTGIMSVLMFLFIAFASSVASKKYSNFGLKVVLTVAFLGASWLVVRPLLDRYMRSQVRDGSMSGNGIGLAFAGLILWGLLGDRVGINALVGGFVWGVIMPQDQAVRHALAAKVRDVAMIFLLPIFFAFAGFAADLKLIHASTIGPLVVVLIAAIAGKFLAAVPAKQLGGLTWQETGVLGALFNTRGLLVLVAGLIGLQATIITPTTFTIIVVVALVTNLMTLPLLNVFSREGAPTPEEASPDDVGSAAIRDGTEGAAR
jgi:Kef-type K+ transport system membrane component KefB